MNLLGRFALAALVFALFVLIPSGTAWADDAIADPGAILGKNTSNGIIWTSGDVGYLIYATSGTAHNTELEWIKTIDGGQNWTAPITIQSDSGETEPVVAFAVWYDRWTPLIAGQRIHIAWLYNPTGSINDKIRYNYLDTTTDVLGIPVDLAIGGTSGNFTDNSISLTKTKTGLLYLFGANGSSLSSEQRFFKSSNNGTSWVDKTHIGTACSCDHAKLIPAIDNPTFAIDDNDVYGLVNNGDIFQYFESVDSWAPATATGPIESSACNNNLEQMGCLATAFTAPTETTVTGSGNPAAFYGVFSGTFGSPDTFTVYRQPINGVVAEATPVFSGRSDIGSISLMYDANERVLYAIYIDTNLDRVYYRKSDDQAVTWGGEVRFDNTANSKTEIAAPPTISTSGGWVMPIFENSQSGEQLDTNQGNSFEVEFEPEVDEQNASNKVKRFVTGIGLDGESGELAFALIGSILLAIITVAAKQSIVGLMLQMMWFGFCALPEVGFVDPTLFVAMFSAAGLLLALVIWRKMTNDRGEM